MHSIAGEGSDARLALKTCMLATEETKESWYEIRFVVFWSGLSAHSYNSEVTGELLVAVGGRANSLLWERDQAARVLNRSNGFGMNSTSPKVKT